MNSFDTWVSRDGDHAVDLRRLMGGFQQVATLPVSRLLLLEYLLRAEGTCGVTREHVLELLDGQLTLTGETIFRPARLVMQDYAGLAALIDVAALRSAADRCGEDPSHIASTLPVDLVIDHSLVTHSSGTRNSLVENLTHEFGVNAERYGFLKWAEQAIDGLNVVPPGQGIVHQLNMETFSAPMVRQMRGAQTWRTPDSVLGTDSHTTMINGLGILGWGIGGIEATGILLGDAVDMIIPNVVGVRLDGKLAEGAFATDLALALAERLREAGVVGSMLEFFGECVATLSAEDRATIANMCPEFGATTALFPFDRQTADFFLKHGHSPRSVASAAEYLARNGLDFQQTRNARYDDVIAMDISGIRSVVAGPFNPSQKNGMDKVAESFRDSFPGAYNDPPDKEAESERLKSGDVVLAAITSCTNTANPRALIAAGLLAKAARKAGLTVNPTIKCTMALGSRTSARLLEQTGLARALFELGFNIDGYGCGACVGNAGALREATAEQIGKEDVIVASVLSGNRNFPGRIHPLIKANYLMSPALVIAYAIAGTVKTDLTQEPLGKDRNGRQVYLSDIWPSGTDIEETLRMLPAAHESQQPSDSTASAWEELEAPSGPVFPWSAHSSYLVEPPFLSLEPTALRTGLLDDAIPILVLGDDVTTDHISPVGAIAPDTQASALLEEMGVPRTELGSYGARRGNHDVMVRGTFANPRLNNQLVDRTGPYAINRLGSVCDLFEAAQSYSDAGLQTVIIAGERYGAGSARDWAAKGTRLLGISAVIATSFERIHRANLVRLGVLPIEASLQQIAPSRLKNARLSCPVDRNGIGIKTSVTISIAFEDGSTAQINGTVRLDTLREVEIFLAGGLLPLVARKSGLSKGRHCSEQFEREVL